MSSKTCLILFGLLIAFAVLSNAEDNSESSLSEEVASARVARSADAGKNKSKSSKKNKRKAKKAKKAAKKAAKMAAKKAKKASKKEAKKAKKEAKKSRKVKKTKQGEKNRQKNISQNERKSSRAVDGACLESAMTAMNRWKGVVANFNKQKSRIEKQSEIAGKKGAKKSVFGPIALKLVDLGGGNKSALTCSGSADSDGAKQLTNLTQTLFACEVEVNKTCSMDFPAPNMTFVDQCAMDIEMFENKTTECYDLSDADTAEEACACWTDAGYTELGNKIKGCKISETSDVAKGLKACKDAFSTCRKYEDDAVTAMGACVVSADTLQAKAAALSTNVDSVSAVSTKVAAVTGSSRRRFARAAATTCADFITLVAKCKLKCSYSQVSNHQQYFQWLLLFLTSRPAPRSLLSEDTSWTLLSPPALRRRLPASWTPSPLSPRLPSSLLRLSRRL